MTRREALKSLAGVGLLATVPHRLLGQSGGSSAGDTAALLKFLESHARDDGGYAWSDQPESHLTPTFAVIGCCHLLGHMPSRREKLAAYIRTHHPQQGKKPEYDLRFFDYQQVQSLVWLGEDVSAFKEKSKIWSELGRFMTRYESSGQPILQHEVARLLCRELLKLPGAEVAPAFVANIKARRRANGSFNHTPATDGTDGHVLNTWWGLQGFRALGLSLDNATQTADWLRQCQLPNGGFTYCPQPPVAGWDDVAYTWAAVRSLQALNAAPKDRAGCVRYLASLRRADGGFGDRPGWPSNPVATWYALDALAALNALTEFAAQPPSTVSALKPPAKLTDELKLFTIQIEAPGSGSPSDAVDMARAFKIDLWTAKNSKEGWLPRAQALAKERGVATRFDVGNEEYGTFFKLPGLGNYSHNSDVLAPAGRDFGKSLADIKDVTWEAFRERRLKPLEKADGRLIWQYGENEEYMRLLLDDSIERGGYAAISTHHFGNPDFILNQPFLYRYRHHIPFISLLDAHGNEGWWWSHFLTGFRTFFLAKEPTWDTWLDALKNNWVCAVRHDAVTEFKTRIYGGAPGVMEFVRQREMEWKWWGERPEQIRRPLAVLAVLRPGDPFEAGCPEKGAALRVRTWWDCASGGMPKKPMVDLVSLTLDGQPVESTLVKGKPGKGAFSDCYHLAQLPGLASGNHLAEATVREIERGREEKLVVKFTT